MKIGFHAKLLLALLAIFGIVISIFIVYEPVRIKIYAWKLRSVDAATREDSIKTLMESGKRGADALIAYFKEQYPAAEVDERIKIVEIMCALGDEARAALKTMFKVRCRKEMVAIPAGEFMMGSESGDANKKPVHKVKLSGFFMDKYEVTNEKYFTYECLAGRVKDYKTWAEKHSCSYNLLCPVVDVSWDDAKEYADWLRMRLPTEAEWEYACRAGSTGEYCFGDNAEMLGEYAWYDEDKTHPVGEKKPNKWGLYDILGNVWEWCSDWYDETYYSKSPETNPTGPAIGTNRVLRSSGWGNTARYRSADRGFNSPTLRFLELGFRLCRSSGP
jgi:formylglycine-generating enzyme required for sulfatase activity